MREGKFRRRTIVTVAYPGKRARPRDAAAARAQDAGMSKRTLPVLALAAVLSTTAAGCYGSSGAFHKVHAWNGTVASDKWARSAVHLGLWILPVYELAIVGDFLIFNTVEHLTGDKVFK